MEKLIVKNFGPIKEAEIELTKYVVFIGDTSTGKSVLGKLISIFREFANLSINKNDRFDYRKGFKLQNQLENYNIDFDYSNSVIEYLDTDLYIKLANGSIDILKDNRDNDGLQKLIDRIGETQMYVTEDELKNIFLTIGVKDKSIYFPPERILTSLVGSAISGLWANNVALPECFKNFAAKYEVARKQYNNVSYPSFGFNYKFENGQEFILTSDNKSFNLSRASSGIQSLLPVLLVLDYELNDDFRKPNLNFLFEEPELSLFPIKQKQIIDYTIFKINSTKHKLIITTHSPYILSILDTLILAKNTFNEHPDLKEEINAIVPESNWIDYNDISVYEVRNDGKVYSIKNEEFKSIDTNAIDGASDIISEEFDKLTELRYAQ